MSSFRKCIFAGKGSIYVLEIVQNRVLAIRQHIEEPDVITDASWRPSSWQRNDLLFVTGCGRGMLKLYNGGKVAVKETQAHYAEIASTQWYDGTILSCSWDRTFKVWNEENLINVVTSPDLKGLCFEAKGQRALIATALSNCLMQLWDTRDVSTPKMNVNHGCEVTCVEWHKGDANKLITGCSDSIVRLWDLRNPGQPLRRFLGHDYAVRKVVTCHFNPNIVLSCSYDKTVRRWDLQSQNQTHQKLKHHSEFVYGLDTSPWCAGMAVDCSWDSEIKLFYHY